MITDPASSLEVESDHRLDRTWTVGWSENSPKSRAVHIRVRIGAARTVENVEEISSDLDVGVLCELELLLQT